MGRKESNQSNNQSSSINSSLRVHHNIINEKLQNQNQSNKHAVKDFMPTNQ